MIKTRITKLRQKLTQLGLDGLLVFNPANRSYLSGFTGTSGFLLMTKKQNFLFTDFRYLEQATNQAREFQIIKHDFPITKSVNEILSRLSYQLIGIEADYITLKQFSDFEKELTKVKLVPCEGVVESLRLIKDEKEIEYIKKAAEIADSAFEHILTIIKPGLTEREVALELEFFMRSKGASGVSFETIVASGERGALPHGVASEKKLKKGQLVTMDFGCIYKGYCSDMTRTVSLGQPTAQLEEIYQIVLKAQLKALEIIKAGMTAKEVDLASRSFIAGRGYGEYFGHGLGHGLGLNIHEKPNLSPRDNTLLMPNMVVTVEPGIYLPAIGGVRIEDLVVIKEEGMENLTQSKKDLIII